MPSCRSGTTHRGLASAGSRYGSTGASRVSVSVPAPSSSAVTVSGSAWLTMRLLSEPNTATSSADSAPTSTPRRMPSGTPPTTRATPGSTARPKASSRTWKGRLATHGSMMEVNTGASAMQVAATEALASFTAP